MAVITEQDRIEEFENLKEILDRLDVAAQIIPAGQGLEQSCLMICMPTDMEDWKEEYKTDLHIAAAYLIQMSDDEEQLTKYLMIYMPIQVDLEEEKELEILRLVNEVNQNIAYGTCFYGKDSVSGKWLLQIKWLIGGDVGHYLDEGVVCETIFELGSIYDMLKERLLKLKETARGI